MADPQPPKHEQDKLEGLPVKTSPYTQYKDLEDYKDQGYGTHGHQKVDPGRGPAASTDAPTAVGAATLSSLSNKGGDPSAAAATDTVNKHGVPSKN